MAKSIFPSSFGQLHLLKAVKSNIQDLKNGKTDELLPTLEAISEELTHLHEHAIRIGIGFLAFAICLAGIVLGSTYLYVTRI